MALNTPPDVILCDVNMPEVSGPELIKVLKATKNTMHIPVIIMTGGPSTATFADLNPANFLGKPFSAADLREAVEQAVSKTRRNAITFGEGRSLEAEYRSCSNKGGFRI